jgi:3'(2'), 5'-bisphosphate nucleotidase
MMIDLPRILPQAIAAARVAGAYIMTRYRAGNEVSHKEDASPVTEADREADRIIVKALKEIAPDIPVVSEEGEKPDVSGAEYFWLVDPLDGTKSFIRGNGYFTVNIGLIRNRRDAALGVIYDPVNKAMYYGGAQGAFREQDGVVEQIHARKRGNPMAALISHSHTNAATEAYLLQHYIDKRIPCASSIKFCILAEGKADIYPRFGPTMEWDVAAGHAILAAAGGKITLPDGQPFLYGKPEFLNGNFIAMGQ